MKEETCYLWISQLPANVTQQTLTDLFSRYGCVLTANIHEAGTLRGAMLSFLDTKAAAKAYATSHILNGQSLISEYCDQSGEPGLQRLKDLANSKFSEKVQVGKQEGSRLKVLKVWNFPDRSPDNSIQSGLYLEYRKVASVQVRGEKDGRHALIVFKRAEDAETAYELTKSGKSFFGMTLNVERLEATEDTESALDEFHSCASRTLVVANIDSGVSEAQLREALVACGSILDVELKPQTDGLAQAIVQFADIRGATAAMRRPEGIVVGSQRARVSYGRSQQTNCVWLANLADSVTEPLLSKTFACHGRLREVCVNSHRQCALVFFDEVEDAQRAVDAMKAGSLAGQRILVDFASQMCQKHFVDELVTSGQCSSSYKLFDQLFAPELHRGIIPSPKSAARYREMMLEYVKATSHRSWRKIRDSRANDASPAHEPAPSPPAEARALLKDTRHRPLSGSVRRKSGHSSDGDVLAKEGQEREQRLLARLSGLEDARSECSDAETSGSIADGSSQPKKSQSPSTSSRSTASAPTSSRRTPGVSDITPVSPQPTGPSASDQDARYLEQAVSAYEAALGAHVPLGALFGCPSPVAVAAARTDADSDAAGAAGEEEARCSSAMPTPPETSVSPTPPLPVAIKRPGPSESDEGESVAGGTFEQSLGGVRRAPLVKREPDRWFEAAAVSVWDEQPYESMYDKIKRRQASRTTSASDAGRLSRPSDSRRSTEEAHQTDRKRARPRHAATSRQNSSAAGHLESDTDEQANQREADVQAVSAAPVSSKKTVHSRPRGRKSPTSSDAGDAVTDPRRRGSSVTAKASAVKRQRRCSKSGKLGRGKMSVDSVFGSSSDSEEAAPATPNTLPMTDSSGAESLADPGSPPASSRLTDIFAEAKAQLDPRSVTEKSLFAFSDDEAFEPAPDLPTIDRIQPDAAAPSPDRREDAEPPKLAAAHADEETAAAHALAQLSQRPPHPAITLAQPQFRVPELMLRPLIPAPPPAQPSSTLPPPVPSASGTALMQPQSTRAAEGLMLHPLGPPTQPVRPPMQPAAQQDLDQFVQDVIRKVQAAPTNQPACWDHGQPAVSDTASASTAAAAPNCGVAPVVESVPLQQPTISLTGGLAQRPVRKSQPAMEAFALQHVDEVICDVVEGRVDLSPYMERGRLRCPSGERFVTTPVPLATTPIRPPSATQSAVPPPPPSLPLSALLPQPSPSVAGAPELRLQPLAICPAPTSTSTGASIDAQNTPLMNPLQPLPSTSTPSIAMTSLPSTSSETTESTCNAAFAQHMQQQQQQQQTQQQVHLQALYMQLLSSRYPQDLLYSHYVPQLQLFQQSPPPPPPAAPPQQTPAQAQPSQLDTLLRKYPVKWQGRLALKNDEAGVQMHFVRGSDSLAKAALDLAAPDASHILKVAQRMRLEPAQLEGVQRKMADETEFCVLLAVACGVNAQDYRRQTHNLREAFIKYLQEKQAAGIVNVNYPGQEVPAYVVHIFPPGQFATSKLQQYASDLYASLFPQPNSETPHLLVVVTTV